MSLSASEEVTEKTKEGMSLKEEIVGGWAREFKEGMFEWVDEILQSELSLSETLQ